MIVEYYNLGNINISYHVFLYNLIENLPFKNITDQIIEFIIKKLHYQPIKSKQKRVCRYKKGQLMIKMLYRKV